MPKANYNLKTCCRCDEEKDLNSFSKCRSYIDGLQYICRSCSSKESRAYRNTKNGLICKIYDSMKRLSISRGNLPPEFTKEKLKDWIFNHHNFEFLFNQWIESGHNKEMTPSCDRTDDYQGYSLDRLRLVTWKENKKKGELDRINGINNKINKSVIQLTLNGDFIAEYHSISQAGRETSADFRMISACCNGKRNKTAGFKWAFS